MPVKQNIIDSTLTISTYDSDLQRISKSVHRKLDLRQNSLLGAQQYTTVKTAAAMKAQEKDYTSSVHASNDKGQNN